MYQIKGKIEKIDLEGGFWGITDINTEKKYLSDEELPQEYQENGLKVYITFEPSMKASAYQWGRMIHIISIEKLSDE